MLRFLACLGLAALFGVSAAARERRAHPSFARLLSTPERWEGAELRLPPAVVRSVDPPVVESDGLRLLVSGSLRAAPGDVVQLRGTFRRGRLELASSRTLPPWSPVPAFLLAWAVWNFFRHFRARP